MSRMEFSQKNAPARSGQSLVEVIIALAIISSAVVAALTLTVSSLSAQKSNEGWVIGGNLAREGIEVVRNMRDSNWLAGRVWNDGLVGPEPDTDHTAVPVFDPETGGWTIDFSVDGIGEESASVWRLLGGHPGIMVQAAARPEGTVPSGFRRIIYLHPVCADQSVLESGTCPPGNPQAGLSVTSHVTWSVSGRSPKAEMTVVLYDWR